MWYFNWLQSGNNSVVECDLAKVEVAGSNPVSRSNFRSRITRKLPTEARSAKVGRNFMNSMTRPRLVERCCPSQGC
jgi:hypothetical protein